MVTKRNVAVRLRVRNSTYQTLSDDANSFPCGDKSRRRPCYRSFRRRVLQPIGREGATALMHLRAAPGLMCSAFIAVGNEGGGVISCVALLNTSLCSPVDFVPQLDPPSPTVRRQQFRRERW